MLEHVQGEVPFCQQLGADLVTAAFKEFLFLHLTALWMQLLERCELIRVDAADADRTHVAD